jgi:hypothetical protein
MAKKNPKKGYKIRKHQLKKEKKKQTWMNLLNLV